MPLVQAMAFEAEGEDIKFSTRVPYALRWTGKGKLTPGHWHDFVLHVFWSHDPAKGFVEVWFDGEKVVHPLARTATLRDENPRFRSAYFADERSAGDGFHRPRAGGDHAGEGGHAAAAEVRLFTLPVKFPLILVVSVEGNRRNRQATTPDMRKLKSISSRSPSCRAARRWAAPPPRGRGRGHSRCTAGARPRPRHPGQRAIADRAALLPARERVDWSGVTHTHE